MPCTYQSRTVFESFEDSVCLVQAIKSLGADSKRYKLLSGGRVECRNEADLGALKQAYQVERAKAAAKQKGLFVSQTKLDDGRIKLTIRA